MTRFRLALGLVSSAGIGAILVLGVRRARRRLVPAWDGLEALLADLVLVACALTVAANIVGALGWFRPLPLGASLLVSGVGLGKWGRSAPARTADTGDTAAAVSAATLPRRADESSEPTVARHAPWLPAVVAAAIAAVTVEWCAHLVHAYRYGMFNFDSLWYHLPMAAHFVQSASLVQFKLFDADIVLSTYPAGSELFHAIGMLAVGSDLLSPLLNFGWAAVLLLAAHVFGRRFDRPHLAVLSVMPVLAAPVVIQIEALSALTEIMGLACLFAAVAFMVQGSGDTAEARGHLVLVGLACGLMASTKFVMLGPAAILLVACAVLERRRGRRARATIVPLVGGTVASGAFWYVRNIVQFGNPVPPLHIGLGGFALPQVSIAGTVGPMLPTLLTHLSDVVIRSDLKFALSDLWPVLLLLPLLVAGAALVHRSRFEHTLLAVSALAVFLTGLVTPQYLVDGVFMNFYSNVRYLLPGITLATAVGAILVTRNERSRNVMAGILAVLCLAMVAKSQRLPVFATWFGIEYASDQWLRILLAAVAAALAVRLSGNARVWAAARRPAVGVSAAAAAVMLVVALPTYLEHRYADPGYPSKIFVWAQAQRDRRFAIEPYAYADNVADGAAGVRRSKSVLLFVYPLYGRAGTNTVDSVVSFDGTRTVRPSTCAQWWSALRRSGSTDVVVWNPGPGHRPSVYERWTTASPTAHVVRREVFEAKSRSSIVVYRVDSTKPPPCS